MATQVLPPPAIEPRAALPVRARVALAEPAPRNAFGRRRADKPSVALARFLYQFRRRRQQHIGGALFSEPAWDILLGLYVARHEGRRISVSAACEAAAAPATTGLRWLNQLEAQGMVKKQNDPRDARRAYVRLTPRAVRRMNGLLNDALAL